MFSQSEIKGLTCKGTFLEYSSKKIMDCETCGFKHVSPLPNKSEWKSFYEKQFYSEFKTEYLKDTEKDSDYRKLLHEDKWNNLNDLIKVSSSPRILDVGSSSGLFLDYFSKKGWEVLGVEPAKQAYEFAISKNRPTVNSAIEEFIENNTLLFDVVHIRECLDNILDPIQLLKRIKNKALRPGGILIIDTSNEFNGFQMAACQKYNVEPWWIKGDGINFFDSQSIVNVLDKLSYKIVHSEATFPLELFLLMGKNYLDDPSVGKAVHLMRVEFEKTLHECGLYKKKRELYTALSKIGLGRNIVVYAKNK